MVVAIISVVLLALSVAVIVRFFPKIFLYGVVAIVMAIQFVAKKILIAVPWIISAFVALVIGFVALGRQFFGAGNAKVFAEGFLPPREVERETFSLTLIEIMLETRKLLGALSLR